MAQRPVAITVPSRAAPDERICPGDSASAHIGALHNGHERRLVAPSARRGTARSRLLVWQEPRSRSVADESTSRNCSGPISLADLGAAH
jgi:hypothetical protein